jgi:hypothetical protein
MSRRYFYPKDSPLSGGNEELDDLWRRMDVQESRRTKAIEVQVGTGETEVRHGLGRVPEDVHPVPRADARVWQPRRATETSVFLAASAAVTVDLYVR